MTTVSVSGREKAKEGWRRTKVSEFGRRTIQEEGWS